MLPLLGLIFDLDGTLVDSAADLRQALNSLLQTHGRRALSLVEVKSMVGDGLQLLLDRAFHATGAPLPKSGTETIFQDFLRFYQNQHATPEMLYPYVRETIESFRAQKVSIGLCTNKLYQPTMKLLNEIDMADLFDAVAGCDTFSVYKPHPGHVLGVAEAMKVPPSNCVMIGDSLNDIRAATAARIKSIVVSHGYGGDVTTFGADAVLSSFRDLLQTLGHLGFDVIGRDKTPGG